MPKTKNPRLPSCSKDPNRRLHSLRELNGLAGEILPAPDSSLESGTSVVGKDRNFDGPILRGRLIKDSQGESVETARDSTSDPET
ncbi:hypothetical protein GHT06_001543 [Daphnia sinensis]|uniref:Uncharacterized protein n=1 Tax=Daphnia sinensis TaxID=1820382 RepID=A0AAD5PK91_9CRUS|nr:hypothetical protein GHT06_001543 [Daphnia sinensis]